MDVLQAAIANPIVHGIIEGVGGALVIDYMAFRSWKKFDDALAYDWPTAAWRWIQGAVGGAIVGAGLGAFLG